MRRHVQPCIHLVYKTFGEKKIQEKPAHPTQRCTIILDNGYTERMLRVWERLGRMVRLRGLLLLLYVFYVATHTFRRLVVSKGTSFFLLNFLWENTMNNFLLIRVFWE